MRRVLSTAWFVKGIIPKKEGQAAAVREASGYRDVRVRECASHDAETEEAMNGQIPGLGWYAGDVLGFGGFAIAAAAFLYLALRRRTER